MILTYLRAIFRLIRPKQWTKNLFVFAPLVFAKGLFHTDMALIELRAFFAFCLAASAVYVMNDMVDAPADRLHPEKRSRPIAARQISIPFALVLLSLLVLGTTALLVRMHWEFVVVVGAYAGLNILYSFKLKEIVLLDVFVIAAGFMLRVLGGALAIQVQISTWLVLCSLFISLFMGFAKRRAELKMLQESGAATERRVLSLYKVDFLDQMLTIAAAGAVISYALYTVAPRTVEVFGTDKLIYTTVLVCYGVFRYLYLIHSSSETENPTNAVTSDIPIIITVALWILACIAIIYKSASAIPTLPE